VKILIVIDYVGSGGAQIQKTLLAKGLYDIGYQVDIFTYYSNEKDKFFVSEVKSYGINVLISTIKQKGFSVGVLKELRKMILTNNYDGVISSMHTPSIYAAFAMIGHHNTKLIVCEESSSLAPVPIFKKILFYISCLKADFVVANSFNETRLLGRWIGLSKKITTIWNGHKISSNLTAKKIVKNKVLKLLGVARVAYPKNGVNLLKALALFYDRNGWAPNLDWAGRSDNDKKSIEMIRQMDHFLLDHPQISSRWTWLGEVKGVNKLYQESDALILVSLYEGVANTVCEAMLEECFVITSNVCDNEIVIGDEERGLLCEPLSPESICNAIERLNDMSFEKKSEIVKNARDYVELNFSLNNLIKGWDSLLNKDDKSNK
jgi:glycosyltransferase involved in cell wall biosynthesis